MHTYNIHMLQAVGPDDRQRQKEFVVDMLIRIGNIISFLDKVCYQWCVSLSRVRRGK